MEKNFWIVVGVLLSFFFIIFLLKELKPLYPTESFITKHMINKNGTLATYRLPSNKTEPDEAFGRESLSESSGLWLQYLQNENKMDDWRNHVDIVKREFLTTDSLLLWKIAEDGSEITTTNALIDDLRVIETLYASGQYTDLANQMSTAVMKYNYNSYFFVDFFDNNTRSKASSLTISYINPRAIQYMYEHGFVTAAQRAKVEKFLKELPLKKWAYPKTYIPKSVTETYRYDKEINLIDQSYIAYHKSLIDLHSPVYMNFIKSEFTKYQKLMGRYSLETSKPTVQYESPALYGLTILYCLEEGEYVFAKQLYDRMIQFRDNNTSSPYYGGYVTLENQDTHIFDNLCPLLAEQALHKKGILKG